MADPESDALRERLRKIEALFAGAGTPGERDAAAAAAARIRARLAAAARSAAPVEMRLSVSDPWARQLLIALCRRYGIEPYRYRRMHRQTLLVRAPARFVEELLWPEFQQLSAALTEYLKEVTARVIREEVHGDTRDAEEREETKRLG
jgi:tRNA nucleotidyltransferase (CCA-adding enzyme)